MFGGVGEGSTLKLITHSFPVEQQAYTLPDINSKANVTRMAGELPIDTTDSTTSSIIARQSSTSSPIGTNRDTSTVVV